MLELWGPLLLIAYFGMAATWRMAVSRFPHPADVASIWIIYYTIPLALLATVIGGDAGLVFLHRAAGDPVIETQCIQYAALSLVCLQLGRWVASRSPVATNPLQFPLVARDGGKIGMVLLILLGQIVLGVYLFGSDVFFSGYAIDSPLDTANSGQALVYMAIELIGLTIAYAYLFSLSTGQRSAMKLAVLAILVLMFLAAIRGKRLEVVSALVSVGVLIFATRKFFRSVRGRLLAVAVLAVLMTTVGLLRLGHNLELLQMGFNLVGEGLFAGHALPGIIDKLQTHQIDYEYGKRAVMGLLAIVPRFVWPDKDDLLYNGDRALDGVRPLGASTILAEVVLQGGVAAVVIWFGFLGYVFERLHHGLRHFDADVNAGRLPASTIGYLISVTIFIPHFRDGMVPAIKLAFQASLFFYALAGLSWRLPITWGALRRREPSAA
jgi:hypothetical protein